jgi:hypothetical protein
MFPWAHYLAKSHAATIIHTFLNKEKEEEKVNNSYVIYRKYFFNLDFYRIIINDQCCGSGELYTAFGFYLSGHPGSGSRPIKKVNFLCTCT